MRWRNYMRKNIILFSVVFTVIVVVLFGIIYFNYSNQTVLFPFSQEDIVGYTFKQDVKIGYMDVTGKIKIKPQYDYGAPFSEGLAVVRDKKTKKYGYINLKGEYVIKTSI